MFIVGIISYGCNDYLDINYDPNLPQKATGDVILPPLFQDMARGELFDTRYIGMYVQNIGSTSSNYRADIHGFFTGSDAIGEKWRQHYWAIGKNVDLIVEDAIENEKPWYAGAALAMRAWSWQTSTDVYGEMILKQAWEPNRYVFDYDTQEEIYEEVRVVANKALEYLNMNDESQSLFNGDLAYQGDATKWEKFVYAVLARNAHHISNKATYDPDLVISLVENSFTSNSDNFYVPHEGTNSTNSNFLGPRRSNFGSRKQAAYPIRLVDGTILNGVVDPRLPMMFNPSVDGQYRGVVNGSGDPYSGDQKVPTFYNNYIFFDNADYPIMTYSELQFIKSEAAFIKGDKATAYSAYINGISAHMDFVGVDVVDRDNYLASAAVAADGNVLTVSDIMLQKYIAMWAHGALETWVDMRRYEYSNTVYKGFNIPNPLWEYNNGNPAYRCRPRYNSEYVWNIEALEVIGATAMDYHTKKPWFVLP